MCSGSKRKLSPSGFVMEGESQKQKEGFFTSNFSILLELSASDDLIAFERSIEEDGFDIDEASCWYGRSIGSKKMGLEERTPLMIAAMFGSSNVLTYILSTGLVDVNRACGSDGVTALHCAAAGGSSAAPEIVKLLLDASADVNSLDVDGRRPGDVISMVLKPSFNSKRKTLEMLLKGSSNISDEVVIQTPQKDGSEKKEYPIDLSLPDIKNGIYGTDEFRIYTFKVKPCSRAYSHDWTECPFVHPGENARRRDPRKYHYSCVPCPEFRKGTCRQGDACEYAHGVFECWLHPAQYRTRLCKDETGCTRRVCFFAHKPEELRPLYASTGSAVPSPRSSNCNVNSLDMLALGSPSALMIPTSTPPMSPGAVTSSPVWSNQGSLIAPPTLQLPGSRLKSAISARDVELDMDLQRQLMDEISNMGTQRYGAGDYSRLGGVKPTNLDDVFATLDPTLLSQLQGIGMKNSATAQLQSPSGIQVRQTMNQQQIRSSYPTSLSSPRAPASFGLDPSGATAAALMSSRSAAFAKRSQSFIDRGAVNHHLGFSSPASSNMACGLSDWSSPDGKLDWGVQGEELNKLRKSASFGFRNGNMKVSTAVEEPDVSWVQSLVKDVPHVGSPGRFGFEEQQQQLQQLQQRYHLNNGVMEMLSPLMEQLYKEQEQMVA